MNNIQPTKKPQEELSFSERDKSKPTCKMKLSYKIESETNVVSLLGSSRQKNELQCKCDEK